MRTVPSAQTRFSPRHEGDDFGEDTRSEVDGASGSRVPGIPRDPNGSSADLRRDHALAHGNRELMLAVARNEGVPPAGNQGALQAWRERTAEGHTEGPDQGPGAAGVDGGVPTLPALETAVGGHTQAPLGAAFAEPPSGMEQVAALDMGELGVATRDPAGALGHEEPPEMPVVPGADAATGRALPGGSAPAPSAEQQEQLSAGDLPGVAQLGPVDEGLVGEAKARAEQDRNQAQAMLATFFTKAREDVESLAAAGGELGARLDATEQSGRGQIEAAREREQAAIASHFQAQLLRAAAAAAAARERINAAFATAQASIEGAGQTARQQIDADANASISAIQGARERQVTEVTRQYDLIDQDLRAAGVDAAGRARVQAATVAGQYSRVNADEDEDLGHRRAAAWASAARECGESWAGSLVEKANETAVASRTGMGGDLESVRTIADEAIAAIEAQRTRALADLEQRLQADVQRLTTRREQALQQVEGGAVSASAALQAGQAAALQAVDAQAGLALEALSEQLGHARTSTSEGVRAAIASISAALDGVRGGVEGQTPPDSAELQAALDQARSALVEAVTSGRGALEATGAQQITAVGEAGETASSDITASAQGARDGATEQADGAISGMDGAASTAVDEAGALQAESTAGLTAIATGSKAAVDAQAQGVTDAYAQMNLQLDATRTQRVEQVQGALASKVQEGGEAQAEMRQKAQQAAESVQPWWKSVLKVVIAVVVAVSIAIVLGPLLATLGPIALILASAAIGAGTGYLLNGINNVIDGEPFNKGAWTAIWQGALGGALGAGIGLGAARLIGALGASAAPAAQRAAELLVGKLGQVFTGVAGDTLTTTLMSVVTGQGVTLQDVILSVLTNSATVHVEGLRGAPKGSSAPDVVQDTSLTTDTTPAAPIPDKAGPTASTEPAPVADTQSTPHQDAPVSAPAEGVGPTASDRPAPVATEPPSNTPTPKVEDTHVQRPAAESGLEIKPTAVPASDGADVMPTRTEPTHAPDTPTQADSPNSTAEVPTKADAPADTADAPTLAESPTSAADMPARADSSAQASEVPAAQPKANAPAEAPPARGEGRLGDDGLTSEQRSWFREQIDGAKGSAADDLRFQRNALSREQRGLPPIQRGAWDALNKHMASNRERGRTKEATILQELGIDNNNTGKPLTLEGDAGVSRPDGVTPEAIVEVKAVEGGTADDPRVVYNTEQMRNQRQGGGAQGQDHVVVIVADDPATVRPSGPLARQSSVLLRSPVSGRWMKWNVTLNRGRGGWSEVDLPTAQRHVSGGGG